MKSLDHRQQLAIGLVLAGVMAATRLNHFGSELNLPDASLAIFFLAGLYLSRLIWFPVFIAEAGFIDWASITDGVSGWCVTPAYGFLIPAYAALWFAGRWYRQHARMEWGTLLPFFTALGPALVSAFAISNASFYLFSGYFTELGWSEYLRGVVGYFPVYAGFALVYLAVAAALHAAVIALPGRLRRIAGN